MSTILRNYKAAHPPIVPKSPDPVRFGILGAANIAPNALIIPAKSHPEVVIVAVGARDKKKADAFATKHGIKTAYGGYDAVLSDPEVDVVYNSLPESLHFEWTMKALAAGKHVLLEKPACNTEDEAKRLYAFAEKKGLIVMEAFHYRFTPALKLFKQIVDSGEIGTVTNVSAFFNLPSGLFIAKDDFRWKYGLGGGSVMDLGCYLISVARFIVGAEPASVLSAEVLPRDAAEPNVDGAMHFSLLFPSSVTADCQCDMAVPWRVIPPFPDTRLKVVGSDGEVEFPNFAGPHFYHYIDVKGKNGRRTEKGYARPWDESAKVWGGVTQAFSLAEEARIFQTTCDLSSEALTKRRT